MQKRLAILVAFVMAISFGAATAEETVINTNNTNNNTVNSTNTNTNINQSTSTSDSTVRSIQSGETTSRVISPPPTAVAPSMMSGGNNDLCTTGVAGAVQTQILGISAGATVRDLNCERLKLSKTLFDMGMKVAAVSTLCQDERVFQAMEMAGTPCPFMGDIGPEAQAAWSAMPALRPDYKEWQIRKDYIERVQRAVENGDDPTKVTPKEPGIINNASDFFKGLGVGAILLLLLL